MDTGTSQGIQMFTSNDLLNNNTTLQGIGANSRFQINTRDSSNLQRNLFLEYGNHSQLSTATCGIDCLNDTVLLFSNSTTPKISIAPTFPDNTNKIATTSFVTSAISNINATTATNITTTNDNSATSYNLVFTAGAGASNSLLVDSVTGPLTYNPSTGDMSIASVTATTLTASTVNAELRTSSGASPLASFAGTTLTINCNSVTLRTSTFTFTGASNTVATLTLVGSRNNGIYYVALQNNGTNNLTINTGLGANIKTTYSTNIIVLPNGSALMQIIAITLNGVASTIVDVKVLT
jgi:hypothetical protein